MHLPTYVAALSAAFVTAVSADSHPLPPGFNRFAPLSAEISWKPCGKGKVGQCGRFEVPLDYDKPEAGKASLAVARYPAINKPKLGTLFVNPGGPGGSGVDMVIGDTYSDQIMNSAGGRYDIVSWDPRGIGQTIPRADCFKSRKAEDKFWKGTIPRAGLEAPGRLELSDGQALLDYYAQVPEIDELLKELGKKCLDYSPDTLQYVGTAAGVRDMVALHDHLEEGSEKINFWGFSYGTIVGIYFVNMFENRVGRVVLDGVVDPEYWAQKPPHEFWSISINATNDAFTGFLSECVKAGPKRCFFTSEGATVASLRERVVKLIDTAYEHKKAKGSDAIFGSSFIRNQLMGAMYRPKNWPILAMCLSLYEVMLRANALGDESELPSFCFQPIATIQQDEDEEEDPVDYAFQAVTCADAVDAGGVTTKMVLSEILAVGIGLDQIFGPAWGDAGFYCHRWPVRAVERYTGPWNKKLSNKILVVGNKADPITPIDSARIVAGNLYHSAVLVEQDDYGHASLAMHSDCTFKVLKDYFVDGDLPSSWRTVCGTNDDLFPELGDPESTPEAKHQESPTRGLRLPAPVIALACAMGLALVSLVVSYVRGRKAKMAPHAVYLPHATSEKADEEQGSRFSASYPEKAPVLA